MKKIYCIALTTVFLVCAVGLLQASGFRFGMTAAVKEQAKEMDKKVLEETGASQGVLLRGRATNLASTAIRRGAQEAKTPRKYSVSIAACELVKDIVDADPYTIFSVDLADSKRFNLNGSISSLAENSAYPAAGTYNYMKLKMYYLEQETTIDGLPNPGSNTILFRSYFSTLAGTRDKFDMLVSADNGTTWKWIDKGETPWTLSVAKPADPLLQPGLDTIGWSPSHDIYLLTLEPVEFLMPLSAPLVVPENPTGRWVLTINFNMTDNVNWEDGNTIGVMENGEEFWASAPVTTVTFSKE